jgi:hypothetical protein
MALAKTNSGDKLYISSTATNEDLTETEYKALTWIEISNVGNVGERGASTNILSYDTWGSDTALKGKGITDAGSPTIEVAEDLADPGQIALRAVARLPGNYPFKIGRTDGSLEFFRGIVTGPVFNGGRNEDFVLNTFTLGLNQLPMRVAPPVTP